MSDVMIVVVGLMWVAELSIMGHIIRLIGHSREVDRLARLDDDEWEPSRYIDGWPNTFKNKKEELEWRRTVAVNQLYDVRREVYIAFIIAVSMPFVVILMMALNR